MQKISRIYINHFGTNTAWYGPTILDLTSPDTTEAVNAIVNLENTGGKTSLLSYIFSIFDPRQDLFIQHLQNSHHHFGDYFAKDGKPSLIIIEWVMPSRHPGGSDYKLVVGQVVAASNVIERGNEIERVFFAFEPRHGLAFEEIPAPKLAMLSLETMAEFTQWLNQMGRKYPEDFYHTRQQRDWVTHLATTRLLDVDLLVMQRQFNSQEGGMEGGFLSFTDEEDLVRKLMLLTMDAERGQIVRSMVVSVVDKQQKKPLLEARLIQLAKVKNAFEPLRISLKAYAMAQENREGIYRQAAGLSAALASAIDSAEQIIRSLVSRIAELEPVIRNNRNQLVSQRQLSIAMQALQLNRIAERASAAHDDILKEQGAAKKRLRHLEGAISLKKVKVASQLVADDERSYEEELKGLQPVREKVELQGALLRGAIGRILEQNSAKQESTRQAKQKSASAVTQAKESIRTLNANIQTLNLEIASLTAAIANAEEQRNLLLDDGVLDPYDQDADAANNRIAVQIAEKEVRLEALRGERTFYEQKSEEFREQANQHALSAKGEEHARTILNNELGAARTLQEELQQERLLCSLVDSDLCDPDSPSLPGLVSEFIAAMDGEILDRDILLAKLNRDSESILKTRLSGKNDDVDQVVRLLSGSGIRSAMATNAYVADLVQDAEESRRLVVSDPARFLGVCVAKGEWGMAREIISNANLVLSRPVVVALTTLDAATPEQDRLIIPAGDDSGYNFQAAAAALISYEQKIAEIRSKRSEFRQRKVQAEDASSKVAEYQSKFGASKIAQLERDIQDHAHKEDAYRAQYIECTESGKELADKARNLEAEIGLIPAQIAALNGWTQRLQAYAVQHEQPLPARKEQLHQAIGSQQTAGEEVVVLERVIEEQNHLILDAQTLLVDLAAEATQLLSRRDATEIFDQHLDCQAALDAGFDLQLLIKAYENDKRIFDTKESERLGARLISIAQLRKNETASRDEYRNEFSTLVEADVEDLLTLDLVNERAQQIKKVDTLDRSHVAASSNLAIARDQKDRFFTQHQPIKPPEEVKALSDDDLIHGIAQVVEAIDDLQRRIESDEIDLEQMRKDRGTDQARCEDLAKNQRMLSSAIKYAHYVADTTELFGSGEEQLNELLDIHQRYIDVLQREQARAQSDFQSFTYIVSSKPVQDVDPGLSDELSKNTFENTYDDLERLAELIQERIEVSQSELSGMQPDFENCVGEIHQLVDEGMSVLKKACEVKIPVGAPYVGGKAIMRMTKPVTGVSTEYSRLAIGHYLNTLIESKVVPESGADLVAAGMINLSASRNFGLQLLQMEQNAAHQYQDAGRLKKSGGQGVVIAMFLYLMMSQLRRTNQAVTKRGGGCPLILDNPFAKVQTRALIDVQIMLAKAIGVQLVFFTAMKDVNILAGFERIIRLRKSGVKNNRSHIELVSAIFNTDVQRPGGH